MRTGLMLPPGHELGQAAEPGDVTSRLRQYAGAGAETVVFAPACPAADLARVIETFATGVAPELRPSKDGSGSDA
jgi:hypothetical protein